MGGGLLFRLGYHFKTPPGCPRLVPLRTVLTPAQRGCGRALLVARDTPPRAAPATPSARVASRSIVVVRRRQPNHEPTRRDGALLCPDRSIPIVANGPNPEPQLVIKFPQNRVARELGALAVNLSLNARNAELMCTNKGLYHLVARVERTKDPLLMKARDDDDTGATQRRQGAPSARETRGARSPERAQRAQRTDDRGRSEPGGRTRRGETVVSARHTAPAPHATRDAPARRVWRIGMILLPRRVPSLGSFAAHPQARDRDRVASRKRAIAPRDTRDRAARDPRATRARPPPPPPRHTGGWFRQVVRNIAQWTYATQLELNEPDAEYRQRGLWARHAEQLMRLALDTDSHDLLVEARLVVAMPWRVTSRSSRPNSKE